MRYLGPGPGGPSDLDLPRAFPVLAQILGNPGQRVPLRWSHSRVKAKTLLFSTQSRWVLLTGVRRLQLHLPTSCSKALRTSKAMPPACSGPRRLWSPEGSWSPGFWLAWPWGAPAAAQREGGQPGGAWTLGQHPSPGFSLWAGNLCLPSASGLRGESPGCGQPRAPTLPGLVPRLCEQPLQDTLTPCQVKRESCFHPLSAYCMPCTFKVFFCPH